MKNPLSISQVFDMKYETKAQLAETALLALSVVFETLSGNCGEMKMEIAGWEEGRTFAMGILPDGPAVTLRKEKGKIKYLGKGIRNPELAIYFKNMDSALLVFLGQMGAHTAAIQRRTIIHGNLGKAVETVRAMAVVQKYLFPDFIVNATFKRKPTFTFSQKMLKAQLYATLAPSLILNSNK